MIDFPTGPTLGQVFQNWTWDGVKWAPVGTTIVPGINDNRIINGDMRIDQRNNGASGTATNGYTLDRWIFAGSQSGKATWQRIAVAAPGFPYAYLVTSSSAYSLTASDYFFIYQPIEADMVSDFRWGTAGAQPVTLSFWALSTLTGMFGGSIKNADGSRSYPFLYSIPVANTWTKIAVTIPGDTAGTWVMSGNGVGLMINFTCGSGSARLGPANAWAAANYDGATGAVSVVGTNGAQLLLTGVKLEIGSVATPFNRQSLAKSMADCQRYYQALTAVWVTGVAPSGNNIWMYASCQPMRATPTATLASTTYSGANTFAASPQSLNSIQCGIISAQTTSCWGQSNVILTAEL